MCIDVPEALTECEARSLNIGSKENTPNLEEGETSCSSKVKEKLSEYEMEKQRNIQRNKELLQNIEEEYAKKHGAVPSPLSSVNAVSAKQSRKRKGKSSVQAERKSSSSIRWEFTVGRKSILTYR